MVAAAEGPGVRLAGRTGTVAAGIRRTRARTPQVSLGVEVDLGSSRRQTVADSVRHSVGRHTAGGRRNVSDLHTFRDHQAAADGVHRISAVLRRAALEASCTGRLPAGCGSCSVPPAGNGSHPCRRVQGDSCCDCLAGADNQPDCPGVAAGMYCGSLVAADSRFGSREAAGSHWRSSETLKTSFSGLRRISGPEEASVRSDTVGPGDTSNRGTARTSDLAHTPAALDIAAPDTAALQRTRG